MPAKLDLGSTKISGRSRQRNDGRTCDGQVFWLVFFVAYIHFGNETWATPCLVYGVFLDIFDVVDRTRKLLVPLCEVHFAVLHVLLLDLISEALDCKRGFNKVNSNYISFGYLFFLLSGSQANNWKKRQGSVCGYLY